MHYWRLSLGNLSPIAGSCLASEELAFDVIDNRFALMFAISAVPEWLFCNVGHDFSVVRPLTNLLEIITSITMRAYPMLHA